MIPLDVWIEMILRLVGSAIGAAMALVYSPPRTRKGFIRRVLVGLGCGLLFAGFVGDRIGFPRSWEGTLQSASLTAFVSWWCIGALHRILRSYKIDA